MFLETIHRLFLGPAVLAGLFLVGGYFCFRLRLFWLFHPHKTTKTLFLGEQPKSVFVAVCLALAGTMGVGNITGVALALITGGPGAIFWMLLSAFFAMAVKYAEVTLAMDSRKRVGTGWQGGAPFYMKGKGKGGHILPLIFSILCVACAVFQGSVIQGNAAALSLSRITHLSPVFCGASLTILTLIIFFLGRHKIPTITALLIPCATGLYLVMCLAVIFTHASSIPSVIRTIFDSAFTPKAGVGGVLGFLLSDGARIGCARGLLSNEAGCGTAPLAHITAEGTTPARQGIWGIFEVTLDTVVVCTLTAFACLCALPTATGDVHLYITEVFASVFGTFSPFLVGVVIVFFAFSTTLTWAFYGLSCLGKSPCLRVLYLILYALCVTIGAACSTEMAFSMTDVLLGIMTLINLVILLKKADRVVTLSAKEGLLSVNQTCGYAPAPGHPRSQDDQGHPQTPAR